MTASPPSTGTGTASPEPEIRPGFAEVNGPAAGGLAIGAAVVALAVFAGAFGASILVGSLVGFGVALLDLAVSARFMQRSADAMAGPRAAEVSGISTLAIGFLARLVVVGLVGIGISQRFADTVDVNATLVSYVFLHLATLSGWMLGLIAYQKRANRARAALSGAAKTDQPS